MKTHFGDRREFNTPAEMLVRVTFVVMLGLLAGGLILTGASVFLRQWPLGVAGFAAMAAGWIARERLKRTGKLESADMAFDTLGQPLPAVDAGRFAELVSLLREWERLEQSRGTPGFDPWAVQAVRHDIRAMVENDPALAELFQQERERHAA